METGEGVGMCGVYSCGSLKRLMMVDLRDIGDTVNPCCRTLELG